MLEEPKKILINKAKKWIPYLIIMILSIILIWQIGLKKYNDYKASEYQKCFMAGQQDVSNFIANQLSQQGFLKIKIIEGQFLILQPTATTSE